MKVNFIYSTFCFLFSRLLPIFLLSTFYFLLSTPEVSAAVLYLEPSEGEYHQGDVFIADLKVDTEGETINTVKADLIFPQKVLEVTDFSKGESVLTFFVKEPILDNEKGEISIIGGVPGGYKGQGLVGKIIFKVMQEASLREAQGAPVSTAKVEFLTSSQVLLNDGLGTPAKLTVFPADFNIFSETTETPRDEWKDILAKDKTPPEPFEIIISQDSFVFDGKYFIVFSAIDLQSGIDYYEAQEGSGAWRRGESPYLLEDQSLSSIIRVKAVDKAGNERIVEYKTERKGFPYGAIILVIIGAGGVWVVWRIIRKSQS